MALAVLPDEISRHVEAVILLSKRDILLKILHEADLCLQFEQITAATVLAKLASNEASLLVASNAFGLGEDRVEGWRDMRNQAIHSAPNQAKVITETVKSMLTDTRKLLEQIDKPQDGSTPLQPVEDALIKVRGKYAFVQTSVDEFLKRKHDDLEREAQ